LETRLLVVARDRVEELPPGRVVRHRPALLEDDLAKLIDAELRDDELEPGLLAVLLLAEAGEDAADRPRHRQQFFLGQELVEQLGLVRHGAEAAADVQLEPALLLAVDDALDGDPAEV